jgi:DNA-binding transcriptional regulator YdaS (Cro superfamily)
MTTTVTPFEALQSALVAAGTQAALASICGVTQPAVWKWLQSSKRLPAEHCIAVERETGVSKHLLRPDIYPTELSSDPHPMDDTSGFVDPAASTVACDQGAILHRAARA